LHCLLRVQDLLSLCAPERDGLRLRRQRRWSGGKRLSKGEEASDVVEDAVAQSTGDVEGEGEESDGDGDEEGAADRGVKDGDEAEGAGSQQESIGHGKVAAGNSNTANVPRPHRRRQMVRACSSSRVRLHAGTLARLM
jgi:hypothetical protein